MHRFFPAGRAMAAVALLLLAPMLPARAADTVVVTAARMVDLANGTLVADPQITISDGRIAAVATRCLLYTSDAADE